MRRVGKIVLALACAALLAGPAAAQQKKGFGGAFGFGRGGQTAGMLLQNEGVQKELKLTEDQIDKVKAVNRKVREKYAEDFQKLQDLDQQERFQKMGELGRKVAEETDKELAGVLKPEQDKRLKQILRQQQGVEAFQDAQVQKDLKLTDEQKESMKAIAEDARKDAREAFQNAAGDFQELGKKMQAMRKEAMDKALAVLKDDQKKEWKELTGEPFTVQFQGFGKNKEKG